MNGFTAVPLVFLWVFFGRTRHALCGNQHLPVNTSCGGVAETGAPVHSFSAMDARNPGASDEEFEDEEVDDVEGLLAAIKYMCAATMANAERRRNLGSATERTRRLSLPPPVVSVDVPTPAQQVQVARALDPYYENISTQAKRAVLKAIRDSRYTEESRQELLEGFRFIRALREEELKAHRPNLLTRLRRKMV